MTPIALMRTACAFLCLGLAGTLLAQPAAPAAATANPTETCLACHAAQDAKGSGGKSIAVDGTRFAASVHGSLNLKCTDCHTDVSPSKIPHPEKLKPVECAKCHEKAAGDYSATVHAKARQGGNTVAANCADCHGTHDILRSAEPASRTSHANVEATCSRCHGDDATVTKANLPGGNVGRTFHDSIHGRALKGAAQGSAPTCSNCHGAHSILAKDDPNSRTHRAKVPDTCGTCHKPEREAFLKGMHGRLRQDGVLAAPGCTDCHSAHAIRQHETARFQTEVIKECGTCHADYLKTYRDTFHGQATALGYARMATCASCHGAHEVLPTSNPASSVSPQNRLQTCQKCHANASANFATFDPHANKHDKARNPLYFYAARFMELLLFGVFAFFGLHTVLWFYRSLREKLARGGKREERH